MRYFGQFAEVLNPKSRRLVFGVGLNAVGGGMTLTLLLVYLYEMRGFSTTFGGLLLAWSAFIGLLIGGPSGALIDRIGPKKVVLSGVTLKIGATAAWAIVDNKTMAIIVATLSAIGDSTTWPGQTVMLTRLTKPEFRQKIFGLNFMLLNLGLGLGGFLAALIVSSASLRSFQILYLIDALTFLLFFFIIFSLRGPEVGKFIALPDQPQSGSYREVLKNRAILRLTIGGLTLLTFGYGALSAGIPIYATQFLGLSPKWLGIIFGANTITIFLLQPLVLKYLDRIPKYWALIATALIWALSWLFVGITPLASIFIAGILLCVSQIVFAFGEMIWSPIAPALANELAPEHLRGRVNALIGMQWGVSGVIGPAIAGPMLGAHLELPWVAVMTIGALLPIQIFSGLRPRKAKLLSE
jgi:MFS family permease